MSEGVNYHSNKMWDSAINKITEKIAIKGNIVLTISLILFISSLALGIRFMNDGLFHYDSIILAQAVEKTFETGELHGQINQRYGSVILHGLVYFPFWILGYDAEWPLLFAGVLFHALSVAALFLFIQELTKNTPVAVFTAMLFSVSPAYFSTNTVGKEHGTGLFVLFLGFWLLLVGLRKDSWKFVALGTIITALSTSVRENMVVYMPFFYLLYIMPQISIVPLHIKFKKVSFSIKNLIAAIVPMILVMLVMLKVSLYDVIFRTLFEEGTGIVSWLGFNSPTLGMAVEDMLTMTGVGMLVFGLIGFIVIVYVSAKKKNIFLPLFIVLWSVLFFYFANTSGYRPRHLDAVIVALFLCVGYGGWMIYSANRWLGTAAVLYFVLSMFMLVYPILDYRHAHSGGKEFALYIKEITQEDDIILSKDDAPFIKYYGKRETSSPPIGSEMEIMKWIVEMHERLKEGRSIYLTESSLGYDSQGVARKLIGEQFNVTYVGSKETEDFHQAEIQFVKYNQKIWKLGLKA